MLNKSALCAFQKARKLRGASNQEARNTNNLGVFDKHILPLPSVFDSIIWSYKKNEGRIDTLNYLFQYIFLDARSFISLDLDFVFDFYLRIKNAVLTTLI